MSAEPITAQPGSTSQVNSVPQRLAELGLSLPAAPAALGAYVPVVISGNWAITAGQIPMQNGQLLFPGAVGDSVTVEQAQQAARQCILNGLAQLQAALGSLDRIRRIVRLDGYVCSAPGFQAQPSVLNAASELLGQLFGDAGRHARVAVGVSELPLGAPVEIALWVEFT